MRTAAIIASASALGLIWAVAPVTAEDLKTKAERAGEKMEQKAERAGDKLENKTERLGDKVENKTRRAGDKVEREADRTGDKAESAKDKLKAKMHRAKDKLEAKADRAHVKNAQQALRDKGHDPGPVDGIHGPRTSSAVRDFQKAQGLPATGRLDDATLAKLDVRTSDAAPSASPVTAPQTHTRP